MPFQPDDVYVGMIAFFSVHDLRRNRHIRTTARIRDKKPRPFVCYAQEPGADGQTYWACFTGTPKPWRMTVSRKWLRCPVGTLGCSMPMRDLIVSEGRDSFVGPSEAFARYSQRHDQFDGIYRPVLMTPGVDEVRRIVRTRGGLLPPTAAPAPALALAA